MNITSLLNNIKEIAGNVHTVRSVYDGDVYTIWNTGEIKYASFVVSIKNVQRSGNTRSYSILLYYGDRLMSDCSNRIGIWDDATNTLQSVLNKLSNLDCVVGDYTVILFEQKFLDLLAGGYVEVNIEVEDELGECEMNDIILDNETLIERLKEAIRKYQGKDDELSTLLAQILFKLDGTVVNL